MPSVKRIVWQALLMLSFITIFVGFLAGAYLSYLGFVALFGFMALVVIAFWPYEKPPSPPIISVSVNSAIGGSLFMAALFGLVAVAGLYSQPVDYRVSGLLFLIAGAMLYGSFRLWLLPTRGAEFFDDHFDVAGRGMNSIVRYADVVEVLKVRQPSLWYSWTRVRLKLRNQDEILLPGNPTMRKLKSDLYTWLAKKTGVE